MSCWFGVDIGASKILAVAVSEGGVVVESIRVPTPREGGAPSVLERVVGACRSLEERHGRPQGVGAGFAGLVDWRDGHVQSSIMLPGWDGFPLAGALAEACGAPAFADNDATAAGFGEWIGLGSPSAINLVVLTVG